MRDPVPERGRGPGRVRVPGVRVPPRRAGRPLRHRQVLGENPQHRVRQRVPRPVRDRPGPVGPLAVHGQVDKAGRRQRPGQVLHVHPGPAVDVRRVLAGQQRDLHPFTTCPLPTTVMPPGETAKPRARSCSLSTPILAPSGTMTFLSMIASLISTCLPTETLCSSTARSTVDQEFTRTPGDSTQPRTSPPDTITPLETSESIARPTRSPLSCTNLAGGSGSLWVRIGHSSL